MYFCPVEIKTKSLETKGEAFAKILSVVALRARSDKRKSESLGGKSKSLETKSKSLENDSSRLLDFFSTELVYFSTESKLFSRGLD